MRYKKGQATIARLHPGLPFTVSHSADANRDRTNNDRSQLIGDPCLANPIAGEWFDITAFAQNNPATGKPVDGNSRRNFLDVPGYRNVDLAVFRNFPIREQ